MTLVIGFPGGSVVRNPPAMQETQVRSLGWEGNGNPLRYSCLENPMDRDPGRLQSMGSKRRDLATKQQKCVLSHILWSLA